MKKLLLGLLLSVVLMIGLFLTFVTIADYRPDAIIDLEIVSQSDEIAQNKAFTVHTWNIGYAGLGASEDFFMDGGTKGKPDSEEDVLKYMGEIIDTLAGFDTDFLLLQEVDTDSTRTYHINELELITQAYETYDYHFAKNFDVTFVPVPLPPIGEVTSGIATLSRYKQSDSKRYQFEGNYAWPKSTVMLDRCFTTTRIPLEDKTADLLLINAHFSAYDDGSLRAGQLQAVKDFLASAYEEGYYVVLGGDWNQTFDSVRNDYPLFEGGSLFMPSVISSDWLDAGWQFGVNDNAPTYRLLNAPYEEGITQVGVIDGFLVSPNVVIKSVEVVDLGFESSDHNPVKMMFELK